MEWLNRGISLSVEAVTSRGGMVNKFTGDGMLAVFGAPLSSGAAVDAQQAVAAAMAIQSKLDDLNIELEREGLPPLRMRIGIHSGQVLTGSLGSTERLEYAVIGDTVNCASRWRAFRKSQEHCARADLGNAAAARRITGTHSARILGRDPCEGPA